MNLNSALMISGFKFFLVPKHSCLDFQNTVALLPLLLREIQRSMQVNSVSVLEIVATASVLLGVAPPLSLPSKSSTKVSGLIHMI